MTLGYPLTDYFGQWLLQPPCPLHSFWPEQECCPPRQPPLPLHSFWPLQHDFSPAALGISAVAGESAGWLLPPQALSAPNIRPAPAAANVALEIPYFIEGSFQSEPPPLGGSSGTPPEPAGYKGAKRRLVPIRAALRTLSRRRIEHGAHGAHSMLPPAPETLTGAEGPASARRFAHAERSLILCAQSLTAFPAHAKIEGMNFKVIYDVTETFPAWGFPAAGTCVHRNRSTDTALSQVPIVSLARAIPNKACLEEGFCPLTA
jgi:hypothetical protein